jgi:LytS/YehU family sensor histidine kinase
MDLAVKQNLLICKIVNSKNDNLAISENGIGINNVKKRLNFLYPQKHELKTETDKDFFVVSLRLELKDNIYNHSRVSNASFKVA